MASARITRAQRGVAVSDAAALLTPGTLDRGERARLIEGFEAAIGGVYTHLPLKRARYGIDPVQRLRILRTQIDSLTDDQFHAELADVLGRLRDAHTLYVGPTVLSGKVAALPFMVEMFGATEAATYIVTKVSGDLGPTFKPGVVLDYWNGVPIDRAVVRHGDQEVGGRPDSMRQWAVQSMTLRALQYGPPPDEHWVVVGYRVPGQRKRLEVTVPWRIIDPNEVADSTDATTAPSGRRGRTLRRTRAVDPAAEAVRAAKMLLYAPQSLAGPATAADAKTPPNVITTSIPSTLKVQVLETPEGPIGYLRIWAFDTEPQPFIDELLRVIDLLPQRGLIIDVRSNPGGYILAAEMALQLFTPNSIEPVRFSVLATELTRRMAGTRGLAGDLGPWRESLEAAVRNGELYAQPLPITDPADANSIGQRYGGPVVLVADARTYSSGDLFSAGFVDNNIGPFVCVGSATGAGGANVWDYGEMRDALRGSDVVLPALPDGVGLSMAFRRATRSNASNGLPIEDVGVAGDPYDMTRDDLLESNRDLIAHCVALLRAQPTSSLVAGIDSAARQVSVTTAGLTRLDAHVDGHPAASFKRRDTDKAAAIDYPPKAKVMELTGWKGEVVLQRRRVRLS
ncbi:MAG: S41 family peptidase [Acidimicrobiia bacterium]